MFTFKGYKVCEFVKIHSQSISSKTRSKDIKKAATSADCQLSIYCARKQQACKPNPKNCTDNRAKENAITKLKP